MSDCEGIKSGPSLTTKHFAIRRVRAERVKIGGITFGLVPETVSAIQPEFEPLPWPDEFDGTWWVFGRYWVGDRLYRGRDGLAFVEMWGTPLAYRSADPMTDWPGPNCVDGFFRWTHWREIP